MARQWEAPALLDRLSDLAAAAAREIQQVASAGIEVAEKADASPVTEADQRAEAVILDGLRQSWPDVPVVAEEAVAAGLVPETAGACFFLVDPLDGTKEFVNRRTDYTVNIALVCGGVPVAGVVWAPARGVAYRGASLDGGNTAEKAAIDPQCAALDWHPIAMRQPGAQPVIVASRSHMTPETEAFLARFPEAECISVGSSLKFCLVAEGSADLYPRFGPTMEWDTAAGDAVLRAAGGMTRTLDGNDFLYGKRGGAREFLNPHFIAGSAG